MPRIARLILTLIMGLALLTWAASGLVQTTAREWFERDVSSRTRLVLISATQTLANAWYGEPRETSMLGTHPGRGPGRGARESSHPYQDAGLSRYPTPGYLPCTPPGG